MRKGLKTFFIILGILLGVSLACAISLFIMNSVDSSGNVKSFYIRHGELEVTNEKRDFKLPRGVATIFEVNTTIGGMTDYTVTITPAGGKDFDFTVDGAVMAFSGVGDLSPGFKLRKAGSRFSLWLAKDAGMAEILQSLYPEQTVTAPEIEPDSDCFCLTVISGDGAKSVRLYFH